MSLLKEPANTKGYWRSLDEPADKPAFQDWMSREFPSAASELPKNFSRRRWMQLMGASLAFGGIAGCRWEAEEFAPFTVRPQNRTPGEKQHFSTMWELGGVARPLTVTSIDGRPIKIEGNQEHPASRGGTSAFDQALILSLYDPDRSTRLTERVRSEIVSRTWSELDKVLERRIAAHAGRGGKGFAILAEPSSSPTRVRLIAELQKKLPDALYCESSTGDRAAASQDGNHLRLLPNLAKAKIVACFDADPFAEHPDATRIIRDWADRRDPDAEWMNRLYAFESNLSLTGSNADHRVPVQSSRIEVLLERLEALLENPELQSNSVEQQTGESLVLAALADDLLSNRGESLLIAGPQQPAEVHAAVLRVNQRLGNIDSTLTLVPSPQSQSSGIDTLLKAMQQKQVETLLILDANPTFGTRHSDEFRAAITAVPMAMHLGTYCDETGQLCRWHLPMAHSLESWSDGRTFDGTVTIGQPLIDPLFDGRSVNELLAQILGITSESSELIRQTLVEMDQRFAGDKEWRRVVHDGFVPASQIPGHAASSESVVAFPQSGTASGERTAATGASAQKTASAADPARNNTDSATASLEIVFSFSGATHDGRFANNGWLQETPDAISKLTWDNAALISPATAERLGVSHGDVVRITANDSSVELPVFELPGVALGSIQLTLGYGRTAAGHVGGLADAGVDPVGVDVSGLLPKDGSRIVNDVTVQQTGAEWKLATTQDHFAIDSAGLEAIGQRLGELVRTGTLAEYEEHPDFAQHRGPHHPPLESLWEEPSYEGHAWGMAIDLNRCIGCNACMVACQSENNVPIVGKDQVLGGREMHWIRMDRYFAGDPAEPEVAHQPVACHHCENAPCEQVCPVAATVHSDEGLNDMVYNRCVGTRYCANNCPYKVRRFNFLDYNEPLEQPEKELIQLVINPEVTVRSRGVMEKCTYCVQRIQDTKIDAKNERRSIEDGEIRSACQQACPAQAISFGDLNDPESSVAKLHADNRSYGMLAELNTKPRTKYLARIRNPHPSLQEVAAGGSDHHHVATAETGGH